MTVMFCDLVGSTPLAERLDPEDFRELLTDYQQVCAAAVERFSGYTALYVGDGVVAYFGYPRAHEDDATRAVHAALGILEGLEELNTSLRSSMDVTVQARIGLHSGVVVVSENVGELREQLEIVGEPPHVAQRLESIAPAGSIVISDATLALVEGYFETEPLGEQTLKGLSRQVTVHRVLKPTGAIGRLEAAKVRRLTPLVGRDRELDRLLEAWRRVPDGHGAIAHITGDPGLGKSRLVHALIDRLKPKLAVVQVWRCSPHHTSTSLHPITLLLERDIRLDRSAPQATRLQLLHEAVSAAGLEPEEAVPLLADLLALDGIGAKDHPESSPRAARTATLRMLEALLIADPSKHPLLLVVEDLHWADPTTVELLGRVIRGIAAQPVMCVLTFRPEFVPSWRQRRPALEVPLAPLSSDDVRELASAATDAELDPSVLEWLDAATDGVPLFVEEMLRTLELRAGPGGLRDLKQRTPVPETLHGLLTERLDRLGDLGDVVDVAAVLGREFERGLLEALDPSPGSDLALALSQLEAHGVLRPVARGNRLEFTHVLLQEAAYERILRRRRRALHDRVADTLVNHFPELAEREPEVVAGHWSAAMEPAKSVPWWYAAGVRALRRAAFVEAAEHFSRGYETLDEVDPDRGDALRRLEFATHLGAALQAGRGYTAEGVDQAYAEARAHCRQVNDDGRLVAVIRGQWMLHLVGGEYEDSLELADEMLALARRHEGGGLQAEGHLYSGLAHMYLGNFDLARGHLEQAIGGNSRRDREDEVYEAQGDTGVGALAYLSMVLWQLGHHDKSRAISDRSLELAERGAGPVTRTQAFFMRSVLHLSRGEAREFGQWLDNTRAYSGEYNISYWRTLSAAYAAWRDGWTGELSAGAARLQESIEAYLKSGSRLGLAHLYVLLADLHVASGDRSAALAALDAGHAYVEQSGERFSESELYRCRARALMIGEEPDPAAASAAMRRAADIAASQNARLPQLRALAQLVGHKRKLGQDPAADVEQLAVICEWFGPACELPDVVRARALLEPEPARS